MLPVFNEYKTVTYMCQHFSKIERGCSQAMKQSDKETFENNMHDHDTLKSIAKAYQKCQIKLLPLEKSDAFAFDTLSIIISKQTARTRSPGC